MAVFQSSPQETEEAFLLHAKVLLNTHSLEASKDYGFLAFSRIKVAVSEELARIYERTLDARIDSTTARIYSVIPEDERRRALIYGHESGPEVFLLPIASFVGGAIASGVVGNLAYDLLKDLYQKSIEALKSAVKDWNERRPSGNKAVDEQALLNTIEIKLHTPDGMVTVCFDQDKGLSPELSAFLTRRIIRYQKEYASRRKL